MANAAIAALHQSTFNGMQIRCEVSDCYSLWGGGGVGVKSLHEHQCFPQCVFFNGLDYIGHLFLPANYVGTK